MEEFLSYVYSAIYSNVDYAHWIIFFALILAGFNIPVSEDAMLIISGSLASYSSSATAVKLFLGVFLGCYLSDWISYWLGRKLGPKLWKISWFAKIVSKERYEKIQGFYIKRGPLVLLIGRFIPFGVRNGLFITAGMMSMNFVKFIIFDGIACIFSNTVLFSLSYVYSNKVALLFQQMKIANQVIFMSFLVAILIAILFFRKKRS